MMVVEMMGYVMLLTMEMVVPLSASSRADTSVELQDKPAAQLRAATATALPTKSVMMAKCLGSMAMGAVLPARSKSDFGAAQMVVHPFVVTPRSWAVNSATMATA